MRRCISHQVEIKQFKMVQFKNKLPVKIFQKKFHPKSLVFMLYINAINSLLEIKLPGGVIQTINGKMGNRKVGRSSRNGTQKSELTVSELNDSRKRLFFKIKPHIRANRYLTLPNSKCEQKNRRSRKYILDFTR